MIHGYLRTLLTFAGFVCIVLSVLIFVSSGVLFSVFSYATPAENWGIAAFIAVVFFAITTSGAYVMQQPLTGGKE